MHDNAPAHKTRFVTDFLESEKVTVLPHPLYLPDLAPCDYFQNLNIIYLVGIHPYYVDILKNKNERAMLSKLRISALKLAIEGGRYLNIPKHERICAACNSGEVEDEEHFLLNCSLYNAVKASSVFKTPMSKP